jgi:hypothetical protein
MVIFYHAYSFFNARRFIVLLFISFIKIRIREKKMILELSDVMVRYAALCSGLSSTAFS